MEEKKQLFNGKIERILKSSKKINKRKKKILKKEVKSINKDLKENLNKKQVEALNCNTVMSREDELKNNLSKNMRGFKTYEAKKASDLKKAKAKIRKEERQVREFKIHQEKVINEINLFLNTGITIESLEESYKEDEIALTHISMMKALIS